MRQQSPDLTRPLPTQKMSQIDELLPHKWQPAYRQGGFAVRRSLTIGLALTLYVDVDRAERRSALSN